MVLRLPGPVCPWVAGLVVAGPAGPDTRLGPVEFGAPGVAGAGCASIGRKLAEASSAARTELRSVCGARVIGAGTAAERWLTGGTAALPGFGVAVVPDPTPKDEVTA